MTPREHAENVAHDCGEFCVDDIVGGFYEPQAADRIERAIRAAAQPLVEALRALRPLAQEAFDRIGDSPLEISGIAACDAAKAALAAWDKPGA